jgi:hypothetical protein
MSEFGKLWLEALEQRFGGASEIKQIQSEGNPRRGQVRMPASNG